MKLVWSVKIGNSRLERVVIKNILAEDIIEASRKADEWMKSYYKNECFYFIAEIKALEKIDIT